MAPVASRTHARCCSAAGDGDHRCASGQSPTGPPARHSPFTCASLFPGPSMPFAVPPSETFNAACVPTPAEGRERRAGSEERSRVTESTRRAHRAACGSLVPSASSTVAYAMTRATLTRLEVDPAPKGGGLSVRHLPAPSANLSRLRGRARAGRGVQAKAIFSASRSEGPRPPGQAGKFVLPCAHQTGPSAGSPGTPANPMEQRPSIHRLEE